MATFEKRVQVLFDPERHKQLEAAAAEAGVSVGAFIREAVDARLDSESNERLAALQELFARADADAAEHDYPPIDWEEARADYELEMDPMFRMERNRLEAEERERASAEAARSTA